MSANALAPLLPLEAFMDITEFNARFCSINKNMHRSPKGPKDVIKKSGHVRNVYRLLNFSERLAFKEHRSIYLACLETVKLLYS